MALVHFGETRCSRGCIDGPLLPPKGAKGRAELAVAVAFAFAFAFACAAPAPGFLLQGGFHLWERGRGRAAVSFLEIFAFNGRLNTLTFLPAPSFIVWQTGMGCVEVSKRDLRTPLSAFLPSKEWARWVWGVAGVKEEHG